MNVEAGCVKRLRANVLPLVRELNRLSDRIEPGDQLLALVAIVRCSLENLHDVAELVKTRKAERNEALIDFIEDWLQALDEQRESIEGLGGDAYELYRLLAISLQTTLESLLLGGS